MRIIVGLGNPGSEYEGTRHNIGFEVVARLADVLHLRFERGRNQRVAAGWKFGAGIVLSQPQTYMNNSGEIVRALLTEHGLDPGSVIVCCDDLHLPLGEVRLRKQGSDGGHNGLRSVIREVGTPVFPRLRCGIGGATAPAAGERTADYVLSPFEPGERVEAAGMVTRASDGILLVLREGIDRAMNIVNTR